MIRVVVADDSQTAAALLVEILESDPEIRVVGQASDGSQAVSLVRDLKPDLVTLDVHMPVMDGLEATRRIMDLHPTPILIVSGSSSPRDVDVSLHAVRSGALMLVEKPSNPLSPLFDARRSELLAMVKAMAGVKVVRRWPEPPRETVRVPDHGMVAGSGTVRVVAIAASTGGPAALRRVLGALPRTFPVPVLVVQHISAGFASGLARWLDEHAAIAVKLAEEGEPLRPGVAVVAPDDRHLGVDRNGRVALSDAPPILGCVPSGTHLFASVARAYGSGVLAVILSGMGSDGAQGLREVKEAGGTVLAQDEATSVVFGMPRQAIQAGLADAVLPIDEIGPRILNLTMGGPDAATHPGR